MKIIGVDPGSARVGYGIIELERGTPKFVRAGILPVSATHAGDRLVQIERSFSKLIRAERPGLIAIEKIYFAKNAKTAVSVAQSCGVLTMVGAKLKIPVFEYTPLEVKLAVTGHGLADKRAVAKMVQKILRVDLGSVYDDVTDALAISIVACNNYRLVKLKGRTKHFINVWES